MPHREPGLDVIPVPPFASVEQARTFHGMLLLHLSLVGEPGPVRLHDYVLAELLDRHRCGNTDAQRCRECSGPYPCRTVLTVVAGTSFPAPWTPPALVAALAAAEFGEFARARADDTHLWWGSDPTFAATRDADGAWTVTMSERGQQSHSGHLADDAAMVWRIYDDLRGYAIPYGVAYDRAWLEVLQPGIPAANARWRQVAALPYLAEHPRADPGRDTL